MKRNRYVSAVIRISFLMVVFLPGLAGNVRGEVKEIDTTVQGYKLKAKAKFDDLSKKINELGAKAEKADPKKDADVKKKMNELKEKRAVLQISMEKLDLVSKDQWETQRQKVESEMDELEKAYNSARSLFKSE
jgi:BMFP domain-containing protein YqiC